MNHAHQRPLLADTEDRGSDIRPGDPNGWRVDLGHAIFIGAECMANVMQFAAASAFFADDVSFQYAHQARGPTHLDALGLIRACAQAAVDWRARQGTTADGGVPVAAPLADLRVYSETLAANPTPMAPLLQAWGLQRVRGPDTAEKMAVAGDVLVYLGRDGPVGGVVIDGWRRSREDGGYEAPLLATVWQGEAPKAARYASMSWNAVALYRWPDSHAPASRPDPMGGVATTLRNLEAVL